MFKAIIFLSAIPTILMASSAMGATCSSYPHTLTNGTTADATQVMADFNCAALTQGATLDSVTLTGTTSMSNSSGNTLQLDKPGGAALAFDRSGVQEFLMEDDSAAASALGFYNWNGSGWNNIINFKSNGNVGIGTTAPGYTLDVEGTVYATGGAGALSDIRHKKDIAALKDGALNTVMNLRPVTFWWKHPTDNGMRGEQIGFIAQQVEKVLPSAVLTMNDAEKTKGLKYMEIIPVLTKAIQEQQKEIRALQTQVAALRRKQM